MVKYQILFGYAPLKIAKNCSECRWVLSLANYYMPMFKQGIMRFLGFPLAFLYALGFFFARWWGKRRAWRAKGIKVIKLGNLAVGGTGKTPHTAYLAEWLAAYASPVAVVSRGYGRKTREMRLVQPQDSAADVGDEPLWLKQQQPDTLVIVARQRREALEWLQREHSRCRIALLDDAMQHWAVDADAEILLTAYDAPFFDDYWLPAGRLREGRTGAARAHAIIVSQCPPQLSAQQRQDFLARVRRYNAHAPVFFSFYNYAQAYALSDVGALLPAAMLAQSRPLLLSAIARPAALLQFLQTQCTEVAHLAYADHHAFSAQDIAFICAETQRANADFVLTTEKDATRLMPFAPTFAQAQIAVFVLPIRVCFHDDDAQRLAQFLQPLLETKS